MSVSEVLVIVYTHVRNLDSRSLTSAILTKRMRAVYRTRELPILIVLTRASCDASLMCCHNVGRWSRCLGSKPLPCDSPCSRRGCLRKGKGAQAVIQAAPISGSSSHDGAEADCGDLPGSSEGTSGISAMRCHLATWITRRNVEHCKHGIISLEPDDSISAVEAVHFIYKVSCHLLGIPRSSIPQ